MADQVMNTLKSKYLIRPISYVGLERMEPMEYPEPALREAILNAIIHKDYSSTQILLSIYDDRLQIWNPGNLPEELSIEDLKRDHSSYPRNRNIASVFFKAGYIESWGWGINKIIEACIEAGLPEPLIEEKGSISNAQYQEIAQTSKRTATRDLQDLIEKGLIQKSGTTGKGTTYIFQKRKDI